ncbi:BMC domain-containing protein [Tsukamurella soli]|uniref:BMC domain-containing protein n=1 Tax=Tsukamurella soli TaxID=644556 RepID=A0ABP8J9M7_9ACTN
MSESLGMIEVRGIASAVDAADAAVKSANVDVVGWKNVGGGIHAVFLRGDVGAVKAATDAAANSVSMLGTDLLVGVHVIARPHEDTQRLLDGYLGTTPTASSKSA